MIHRFLYSAVEIKSQTFLLTTEKHTISKLYQGNFEFLNDWKLLNWCPCRMLVLNYTVACLPKSKSGAGTDGKMSLQEQQESLEITDIIVQ